MMQLILHSKKSLNVAEGFIDFSCLHRTFHRKEMKNTGPDTVGDIVNSGFAW
ncbi:MAG: hypothetical protein JW795_02295 [Chitinivibrionales bacterium]|nr:hypothetical protein [Chitinivibrionales bacterium]